MISFNKIQTLNYSTKDCHEIPNQYIKNGTPRNRIPSLRDKSAGKDFRRLIEKPNIIFIQDLKKKVGPIKYKNIIKKRAANGNKSRKKVKNNISETKKIDPGNPKKIRMFKRTTKNNFGHK